MSLYNEMSDFIDCDDNDAHDTLDKFSQIYRELVEALTVLLEGIPESVAEAANIQDECRRASAALAKARAA